MLCRRVLYCAMQCDIVLFDTAVVLYVCSELCGRNARPKPQLFRGRARRIPCAPSLLSSFTLLSFLLSSPLSSCVCSYLSARLRPLLSILLTSLHFLFLFDPVCSIMCSRSRHRSIRQPRERLHCGPGERRVACVARPASTQ